MFVDVADIFIQYINTLDLNEIEQLDNDLKANGWGVKSVVEINDSVALLCIFQMFYYYKGRLPLTNGLLAVPDEETPPESEKISLNIPHVFICPQHLFWWRCQAIKRYDN